MVHPGPDAVHREALTPAKSFWKSLGERLLFVP